MSRKLIIYLVCAWQFTDLIIKFNSKVNKSIKEINYLGENDSEMLDYSNHYISQAVCIMYVKNKPELTGIT